MTQAPSSFTEGKRVGRQQDSGRYRWSKRDFFRLDELGFFRDRHVELLGGDIILMTTKPPHCVSVGLTSDALRAAFGAGYYVRSQSVLDLGNWSQPQPDVMVVPGSPRDYRDHHPKSALLVVEVSETTLRYDRLPKMHRYARARIADYWIVNLIDRQLEVYRNPSPDPSHPSRSLYLQTMIVPATGHATPLAAPGAVVAVADLLP